MERRDFLNKIGLGAAFVLTSACLHSCKKDDTTAPAVDFIVDLTTSEATILKTPGNYIIKNQVVIARGTDGNYYAATVTCSHEGRKEITYNELSNTYLCTAHGAEYDLTGKGLNDNGKKGLTIYKTSVTGTTLRIYS